ncbi:MAG: AraC family ligand binding domain-containing protein [Deltaproteobacteria bacterium]|nr:AraC family ligand binding domain-containing protein [Deltaproteobacteria bacterium]
MFIDRHKNEGIELTYMIKGKCLFTHGRKKFELKQGDLLCHGGKEYHSVIALKPCEFLNILFLEE